MGRRLKRPEERKLPALAYVVLKVPTSPWLAIPRNRSRMRTVLKVFLGRIASLKSVYYDMASHWSQGLIGMKHTSEPCLLRIPLHVSTPLENSILLSLASGLYCYLIGIGDSSRLRLSAVMSPQELQHLRLIQEEIAAATTMQAALIMPNKQLGNRSISLSIPLYPLPLLDKGLLRTPLLQLLQSFLERVCVPELFDTVYDWTSGSIKYVDHPPGLARPGSGDDMLRVSFPMSPIMPVKRSILGSLLMLVCMYATGGAMCIQLDRVLPPIEWDKLQALRAEYLVASSIAELSV